MKGRSILGVALILAGMVWLGARGDDWSHSYELKGRKTHYYSLLVHGFLRGQLSLDAKVDPGLNSPDPDVRQHAAYLLDASLYRGKYYIYWGVVPALFIFLPYTALTGQDLPENAAVLIMVVAGFLCYWGTYRSIARRYFPALRAWLQGCILLLLAFGAVTPLLLVHGDFYGVPIAGAYACLAAVWLALERAWHAERRRAVWLASAGTAAGLAVGCRPDYVLAFPALAVLGGWIIWRAPRSDRPRLAAAVLAPVAVIGLLLMAYNYARFDSPFEFGIHYQLNAQFSSGMPLGQSSFFWTNLRWYYLRWPAFSLYFPYIFPMNLRGRPAGYAGSGVMDGQLIVSYFLLFCAAWLAVRRRPDRPLPAFLRVFLPVLLAAFAGLFLGVAFISFCADRYEVDFQSSLILFLAVTGGFCSESGASRGTRAGRAGFGLLAVATALFNVLISLQLLNHFEFVRPRAYHFLARHGDFPARVLTRLGWAHYGPVHFQVTFAAVTQQRDWPLVATGVPSYTDVLYASQSPDGTVVFSVNHTGYGSITSEPVRVEIGRTYDVEVDLGSLYPRRFDPFFDGWSDREIDRLKTLAVVQLDGKKVINQRIRFFDAPPNWVHLGRNPAGEGDLFNGRISAPRRLPPHDLASLAALFEPGVWRFAVTLQASPAGQPVLGSGFSNHGNLLFLTALPDRTVRFEVDQWGLGLDRSPPVRITRDGTHRLEVFVGPQVAQLRLADGWQPDPAALAPSSRLLRVWLDGVPVWTEPLSINLDTYDWVTLGSNPQGFNTAAAYFSGSFTSLPYSAEETRQFIARNLEETTRSR